jgi:SAM-dependent methyltransferase
MKQEEDLPLRIIAEAVPFDANLYWKTRGKNYINEERLKGEFYRRQERFIAETLSPIASEGLPHGVLELGCGYGRITKTLMDADGFYRASFVAMDLSPDQIANAENYCGCSFTHFMAIDIMQVSRFPKSDMCLAIELFLHLQPAQILNLIPKILDACPVLVHDFDSNPVDFVSPHIKAYDYDSLYLDMGLKCETRMMDGYDYGLKIVTRA